MKKEKVFKVAAALGIMIMALAIDACELAACARILGFTPKLEAEAKIPLESVPLYGVHSSYWIDGEAVISDFPQAMLTTAYCVGHTTASGAKVRHGVVAMAREYMGLTAEIWLMAEDGSLGDFVGFFEVLDTGKGGDKHNTGKGAIERGAVIDVYFPDYAECVEWMALTKGKVYVRLLKADG